MSANGGKADIGRPTEATPPFLIWIYTDCDRVVAAVTLICELLLNAVETPNAVR
jgi:hypothetical protein